MSKNLQLIKYTSLYIGMALSTISFINTDQQQNFPAQKEVLVDFRETAKKAIPSVVSIQVQTKKRNKNLNESLQDEDLYELFGNNFWKFFNKESSSKPLIGQASGVIVSNDGYILTNSHVVKDMDSIHVQLQDGREYSAKVLGQDSNSDLALIKIEATNLPYLKLADSEKIEVGQWVAAIGNPFGLQATLTTGVISAKGRNNLDIVPFEDFIQTDASINSGNSGGPLVNLNGEIIGINTAIATNSSAGYLGIGFAIPSNMARYIMDEILSNGKISRGFLGINLQSIDYNLAQAFNLKKIEGALVTNVQKNSPAELAGIKSEDIILKINDRSIENAAQLRNTIYMIHPGTKITLTILRDAKTIEIPINVGQFADKENSITDGETIQNSNQLGIEVENLTPELAEKLGYTDSKGVVVTKVIPGSPASLTGLKKGALIMSINRQKIENKEQFSKAVQSIEKGRPVLFQIRQGDIHAFLSLRFN